MPCAFPDVSDRPTASPRFTARLPSVIVAPLGYPSVRLDCRVTANPPAEFVWYRNGAELTETADVEVGTVGSERFGLTCA